MLDLLAASLAFTLQPHFGYSESRLDWNIAADLSGTLSPNILSELEFKDIHAVSTGLDGTLSIPLTLFSEVSRWQLVIDGSSNFSVITSGENQDSDYFDNNRSSEFSRSISDIDGEDLRELQLGIGLRYEPVPKRHAITLLLGWHYQEQNLNFKNGTQVIADPAFFGPTTTDQLTVTLAALDSHFDTEWDGQWVGLQYQLNASEFGIHFSYNRYDSNYRASAQWNLRSDFAQPESFIHKADADGERWSAGLSLPFPQHHASLIVEYVQHDWETDAGIDTTFFSNAAVASTRLNEANWESKEIRVAVQFSF